MRASHVVLAAVPAVALHAPCPPALTHTQTARAERLRAMLAERAAPPARAGALLRVLGGRPARSRGAIVAYSRPPASPRSSAAPAPFFSAARRGRLTDQDMSCRGPFL